MQLPTKALNISDLENQLINNWREVSRSTHAFLVLLHEFDLREGWKAYGNNDCAEWLDWKCGISRTTALEKLRVAHALRELPQIDAAFEQGRLSYSKVRALTRIATKPIEQNLLEIALGTTAGQLERYCRRVRNGDPEVSAKDAKRLFAARSLVRHLREDGSGTITVDLPPAELALVMKALESIAGKFADNTSPSLFAKGADALVHMAEASLAGRSGSAANADTFQVVVHVDHTALAGEGGQADLPLESIRRLSCDAPIIPLVETSDGVPLNVGRKQRKVSKGIHRALLARDRTCTFPGCHHELYTHAHHIEHWADGGETSLENLVLLCSHHHALVHEGGFGVSRHADGHLYFVRPDGQAVATQGNSPEVTDVRASYRSSMRANINSSMMGRRGTDRPPYRTTSHFPRKMFCVPAAGHKSSTFTVFGDPALCKFPDKIF